MFDSANVRQVYSQHRLSIFNKLRLFFFIYVCFFVFVTLSNYVASNKLNEQIFI